MLHGENNSLLNYEYHWPVTLIARQDFLVFLTSIDLVNGLRGIYLASHGTPRMRASGEEVGMNL